jgi:RNA polymerase-interacting CarD/CdnL/TRCF family regulator
MLCPVFQARHNPDWQHWKEKSIRMEYFVGDKVIHCHYGFGEIVQMDEKFIHERQRLCYVVRIRDLSIWVTADEPGQSKLRLPTPERDFVNLFAILRSPGEPLPVNRFERKIYLSERMSDGELTSICSVIRDLVLCRREKRLNDNDKNILERAQGFLLAEWMYSLSVSFAQANHDLTQLLGVAE